LFRASIVELATISDLVVGRPLWEIIDDTQTANCKISTTCSLRAGHR
jgi:hypothetical protein